MQPAITPAEVRSWRTCSAYTDDRIAALFGCRSTLTAREIAALEIPARDRVWVLCRVMVFRCPGTVEQFTEWCAGRAQDAASADCAAYAADCAAYAAYAADAADAAAARASAAYAAADAAARAAYAAADAGRAAADAGRAERTAQIAKALELIEGRKETP